MIRCKIQGETRDRDKDLHLITMALHATVNRNTGFTPNQLMLGREVIFPEDLVIGSVRQSVGSTPEELMIDLSDRLS